MYGEICVSCRILRIALGRPRVSESWIRSTPAACHSYYFRCLELQMSGKASLRCERFHATRLRTHAVWMTNCWAIQWPIVVGSPLQVSKSPIKLLQPHAYVRLVWCRIQQSTCFRRKRVWTCETATGPALGPWKLATRSLLEFPSLIHHYIRSRHRQGTSAISCKHSPNICPAFDRLMLPSQTRPHTNGPNWIETVDWQTKYSVYKSTECLHSTTHWWPAAARRSARWVGPLNIN